LHYIGNNGVCVRMQYPGVRVGRLENRQGFTTFVSSNLTLSASKPFALAWAAHRRAPKNSDARAPSRGFRYSNIRRADNLLTHLQFLRPSSGVSLYLQAPHASVPATDRNSDLAVCAAGFAASANWGCCSTLVS
jgi:hypothetical protein